MKKRSKRNYSPVYKKEFVLINDSSNIDAESKVRLKIIKTKEIAYYETASKMLKEGKALCDLIWQDFVGFVYEWSFTGQWNCYYRKYYRNDGISFITTKAIDQIGEIKCIWVVKKFALKRLIGVKLIRELNFLVSDNHATKGIIVTTSTLTRGALQLIRDHNFKLSFIDYKMLEKQLTNNFEEVDNSEIPF